jgi:RimJ/RimL family protein N-acetyltransferase
MNFKTRNVWCIILVHHSKGGAQLILRPAVATDSHLIWEWRNDENTRTMSNDTAVVPWETHVSWFERALQNPNRRNFIAEKNGEPLAVLRLDITGATVEISINVGPLVRGQGVGTTVLRACDELARSHGISNIVAHVKPNNTASVKCFLRAAYAEQERDEMVILTKSL